MTHYDYNTITEVPGLKATHEQLVRLYHRYAFASELVKGKDVLEVACGSGIGLGLLAKYANRVDGGDIDQKNIAIASTLYKDGAINVRKMDAHSLPFSDGSLDAVLLFEAIYYLENPDVFVKEACRVLRQYGLLIICTVNKDWSDFHPSPYTHQYFSVPELAGLLKMSFRDVHCFGAFPIETNGISGKVFSLVKRLAVRFDLIPGSLATRTYLKRMFMGPLRPLPERLDDGVVDYEPPVSISTDKANFDYKIIYAIAKSVEGVA